MPQSTRSPGPGPGERVRTRERKRMTEMPEANMQTPKPKAKTQIPPFTAFPGVEAPAAFRDMAEKSLSQAKDNYEKMRSAAEEATGVLENTYATASKGAADYALK